MSPSRITGCMLGAAMGDALGMAGETGPPHLSGAPVVYRRPWRGHPNSALRPGQYTDDTQMMIISARLLVGGSWSPQRYAAELAAVYDRDELRFPDGAVQAVCDRILRDGLEGAAVVSETSGCIPPVIPLALATPDRAEMEARVEACVAVTHNHPSARAAALTIAHLIRGYLEGDPSPIGTAVARAAAEDSELGARIRTALRLEGEGIPLGDALPIIGNDLTVTRTLPLAFFLIRRFRDPYALLAAASRIGGNSDTIGFICGACTGAAGGADLLPVELLEKLEGREEIINLGEGLAALATPHTDKPEQTNTL